MTKKRPPSNGAALVAASSSTSGGSLSLFKTTTTTTWILIVLCASCSSFYVGVWTGIAAASAGAGGPAPHQLQALCNKHLCNIDDAATAAAAAAAPQPISSKDKYQKLFHRSLNHFANGLIKVSKDDMMSTFDFGVPPNPYSKDKDVLILYNTARALPNDKQLAAAANLMNGHSALPFANATTATENCDTLNVILTDNPGNTRQCFALIGGQFQSYHIQRWMRRGDNYGGLKSEEPLKFTSRGWTAGGRQEFPPPDAREVAAHQDSLRTYLNEVAGIKSRLIPILRRMKSKQIVVMTCNHGQSELLMNFVCSSRAKGFDLSNVLVFPTDVETKELADGMGLTTFYEEKLMSSMPKNEARIYGDSTFTKIMLAKILCVQLVNELNYDLLFMDVDIVWYRNPLDYFRDKSLPEFDVYFQDDGSRQERYAPYSANSGFYFVRSNDRTKHLFRHLLYNGDLLNAWYSHQQVLIVLLAEHSSLMGLKVKVFAKEKDEFPGGWSFHRQKEEMKKIMQGESKNYIFHMSWTENKQNKVKFFQQMGQWYVQEACIDGTVSSLQRGGSSEQLSTQCCLKKPLIKCHFRDKPSKIPCDDSPFLDKKKGKPFW